MAIPHRLSDAEYLGPGSYFLTVCCWHRRPWLAQPVIASAVIGELLRTATSEGVAVHAYCAMPDHIHIFCEVTRADASLCAFVHAFKKRTGYWFRQHAGGRLWQASYYDRSLRQNDDPLDVIRYVVENPIRAGLVSRLEDYAFLGSGTCPREQLLDALLTQEHRRRFRTW